MTTVRRSSLVLVALVIVLGLLLIQLGNLVAGVSMRELQTKQLSSSLHVLAHQAPYWHYDALVWLFGWLPGHQTWTLRLTSVIYALIALATLTYIMRRWYGPRTAVLGFAFTVCSAWILHSGRLAAHDIALLAAVGALLGSSIFLHDNPKRQIGLYVWTAVRLLALAVPGMIWLIILDLILHRDNLRQALGNVTGWLPRTALAVMAVILLLPIAAGLSLGSTVHDGLALLGLPATVPHIGAVAATAKQTLLMISIHGNAPDDLWLNHLPLLGPFLTAALLLGIYFYAQHPKASRSRLLLMYALIIFLLICTGGPVTFSALVPIIYLVVAAGIAYLLHRWLKVFPKNPLARSVGIGLVAIAVLLSCSYGLRQYFIAWQHHPEAVRAFRPHDLPRSKL